MFTRFDANKSTKGASKLRRDLINSEIANLRDLLPLPQSTRQRLSQLQLMALVCVYVRKANYFQQVFKRSIDIGLHSAPTPNIGFSKALSGFLMMLTQNGKLLYISDNAAEYLGHSMEDLLIHGDSVYDIIDKQDHGAIQSELNRGVSQHPTGSLSHHHPHHHSHHLHHHHHHHHSASSGGSSTSNSTSSTSNNHHHLHAGHHSQSLHHAHHAHHHHHHHLQASPGSSVGAGSASTGGGPPGSSILDGEQRIFLCRMNVSRNARRQMRFGDQKVVLVQGHYLSYLPLCSRNEPVFIATCTPIAMPETRECVVQGATNVFTTIHSMDMKVVHIDKNGEFHLGYSRSELQGVSWYQLLHWESTREAQSKHRLITQSEQDRSCILLVRMQRRQNDFLWVHVVLQVRDGQDSNQQSVIVCTNQVLSDREASVMLSNSWLYHYYTVQSKMQFGIPFEGATRIPTQQQPQPQPPPAPPVAPPQSASSSYAAYTSTSSGHSPGAASTSGVQIGAAMHGGYTTVPPSQPHPHLAGYHGYHSPSGAGHHNGGTATPMLQGHHHHHANHHQHLQHHQQQQQQHQQHQPGPSSSSGEEYGARGYGFRLESGTQPVDYSGGHPTPPTSAPPTPAMSGQLAASAIPIPVVQLTPHIRCHNGNGQSSATTTSNHGDASGGSTAGSSSTNNHNTPNDHRPPAKKRNRLEPLSIPENSGQSPDSPETSTPLADYHSGQPGSTGHMENGGTGAGDTLHGMNGLDGTGALGSTSGGTGAGGGGGGTMLIGTIASNRTTALGRLHAKSVILPPTVASLGSEPTDFMEQWNPSPPWSDTTAQKVPDISHQELSPYMTTTPPTPTSAPHQMLNGGGGFPTATTFSFDWMPEQFVPIVTDCGVTSVIPHPGTIVTSQTMSSVSGGTLATLSGHGSGSSSGTHAGHVGMVHSATTGGSVGCVPLPPSCLTQDGLPIPGMSLPMVPVPLPIPPPPWPSDHRLLALDGTSTTHGMTSASSETGEERKPLDGSRTGHTGHEQH